MGNVHNIVPYDDIKFDAQSSIDAQFSIDPDQRSDPNRRFDNKVKLDNDSKNRDNILLSIINTPDDSEIGYFFECDLPYPDNIKEKTKFFPFCPQNKYSVLKKNLVIIRIK